MGSKRYAASDIKVLEGLDAVRMRPGMYIGTTGIKGLHHILWEIVDNGIDEASNGFADQITVCLYKDGSASVEDNGRGIPVDIHPKLKVSGVEVVFTQLHAGGKFGNDNYNFSGGLHGVGASVTNALSEWLTVDVYKNGEVHEIEFHSFEDETGKVVSGATKTPLHKTGETTDKKGTFVIFKPDKRVFPKTVFSQETVGTRLRELAFLNKGLKITFIDYRDEKEGVPFEREYFYEGGISDFVTYLNESKSPIYKTPIYLTGEKDGVVVEAAIQHTDSYTESLFSYVNNIPTSEGGTHETGFKVAFTKVMNDYAKKNNILKEKDGLFLGEDLREGITAVLTVKMNNVQFEGQTKTKLGNPEARFAVEGIITDALLNFIAADKKQETVDAIVKKALGAMKVREAARKAKDITRQKTSIENANLVGKLSSCTGKVPEENELFIVEGDSAGGSAKQARDRKFQAILPLRGKPLNAEKKRLDQVLANEEIRTIISALGAGIGQDFDIANLKFHKVIILADADQDGAHIRAILITFFFRYMKELINEGHLYIGQPPLFKVETKEGPLYAYDDNALDELKEKVGRTASVQRYKGLGEMNPEQLWETTMDPKNRVLVQVTLEDVANAEKIITTLMGDDIEHRKEYIQTHADFNKVDEFAKKMGV